MHQVDPASPISNRPLALRLTGALDTGRLAASLDEIVRRHEALRTVFRQSGQIAEQIVLPAPRVGLEVTSLRALPAPARKSEARRIAQERTREPFDLERGPLVRMALLELGPDDHVLLAFMHHIVFDGWSEGLFIHELRTIYRDLCADRPSSLAEPPVQLRDFARWQHERLSAGRLRDDLEYWTRKLDRAPALELPTDMPRPAELVRRGRRTSLTLAPELKGALVEHSRRRRVTLFMTLLSAFKILLSRHAREPDVAVGAPIAGRTRRETEALIGCFMNTLVLRTDLSGDPSFDDVLDRVRDSALDAYAHQEAPFERLVAELRPDRQRNRWPLAQVMFTLRNLPPGPAAAPGEPALSVHPFPFDPGIIGGLDLSLEVRDAPEGLIATFNYATELFDATTIERLGEQFRWLLESAMAHPDRRAAGLALMSAGQRRRLLAAGRGAPAPLAADDACHRRFQAQARRTPEAVAIEHEGGTVSYRELDRRSDRLAAHLRHLGVRSGTLVGVCAHRSPELVVALLAILKAGAAYVPLDPANPPERLARMVADGGVEIVLAQEGLATPFVNGPTLVALEAGESELEFDPGTDHPVEVSGDDLAYVIHTSGSTGTPNAVMVSHRALLNHLRWRASHFPLGADDRLLHRAAVGFDDSLWEMLEPLLAGARLVVAPAGSERDSAALVALMRERRITAACFVPSQLRALAAEPDLRGCRWLRRVTTGGEVLAVDGAERFLAALPVELHNGYGPAEATIAATFWTCRRGEPGATVPIGRPVANTEVHVLDDRLEPVPSGMPGELCIAGSGLARGYLNRPDLTAQRFVAYPFGGRSGALLYRTGDLARQRPDGALEFLGRLDEQVKVAGQRVEPGEIEATLDRHPAVRECAVTVRERRPGERSLAAWVVADADTQPATRELGRFLRERLPTPMVPTTFSILPALPRTPSGKLDRRALEATAVVPAPGDDHVAPRTPTERAVAGIWSLVLGQGAVGRHDDFFECGGHSLLAAATASRMRHDLGIEVSVRDLFEHPTLEALARELDLRRAGAPSSASPPRRRAPASTRGC